VRHADGFAVVPCDAQSAFVLHELELLPASGVVPASGDVLLRQMPSLVTPDWPTWKHDWDAGQLGELSWQRGTQDAVVAVASVAAHTSPEAHATVAEVQSPPAPTVPVDSHTVNSRPDCSTPMEHADPLGQPDCGKIEQGEVQTEVAPMLRHDDGLLAVPRVAQFASVVHVAAHTEGMPAACWQIALATHWLEAVQGCPRAVVPELPEPASEPPFAPLQT
jgi:hypothetical protein